MKKIIAAVIMLCLSSVAHAGDITYNITDYPADEAGYSVSGFITTDGNIGTLTQSDIVSWSWSAGTTSSSGGAYDPMGNDNCYVHLLAATPTQLLLSPGSYVETDQYINGSGTSIQWYNESAAGNSLYACSHGLNYFWDNNSPQMGGTEPWVVAQTASVPEPSTLILLGVCGVAWIIWRRR